MTRLTLLLLALFVAALDPLQAFAQDATLHDGAVIAAAEVSGVDLNALSPGLRRDIEGLAGQPVSTPALGAIASRIESEHPDVVAAVRDVTLADGRVRVIFLAAHISDNDELARNINARYPLERVEVRGIDESRISQPLRDELHALVGERLDSERIDALARKLEAELPDYDVHHSISRGDESGHLRLAFVFARTERSQWIHFRGAPSKLVYQQDLGWSGVLNVLMSGDHHMFSVGLVRGNNDDLVEEYNGFSLGVQSRDVGTKRLGLELEFSRYTQKWMGATVAALEATDTLAAAYRRRVSVQPTVIVAPVRYLRISGGVLSSDLSPVTGELGGHLLMGPSSSRQANAGVGDVRFDRTWKDTSPEYEHVEAGYQFHAGTDALGSDLVYKRQLVDVVYRARQGASTIVAVAKYGRITGTAPLFERFTLGDSMTLRGWNKYEIAPAGADRMMYQSLEYRYKNLAWFVDTGSVWAAGRDRAFRVSTGVGVHSEHAHITVGVPVNGGHAAGKLIAGIGF